MNCDKKDMLLYAVTDRSWLRGRTLYSQVEAVLRGGATFVQLREKALPEKEIFEEALALRELCGRFGVPFVIDDNVKLALRADADGVHVGQSDMGAAEARSILGPGKIVGVTVKTVEQALRAQEQGADYLGCGAVFPTGSKSDARPLDHEVLREICESVKIPVVAIGGITSENIMQLRGTGISGVAVISAIFAQPDPEAAARSLRAQVMEITGGEPQREES